MAVTTMDISTRIMAHRYLYYVLARPVISDREYDELEKEAVAALPPDHPVHLPGSDRGSDYTTEAKQAAQDLLERRT